MIAVRWGSRVAAIRYDGWRKEPAIDWSLEILADDIVRQIPADVWTRGELPAVQLATPEDAARSIGRAQESLAFAREWKVRSRISDLAWTLKRAAIALDPVAALFDALGVNRFGDERRMMDYCRAVYDCFGTSHLPEQHRRWKWKFAKWDAGPTRSERLLAADRGQAVGALFGAPGRGE